MVIEKTLTSHRFYFATKEYFSKGLACEQQQDMCALKFAAYPLEVGNHKSYNYNDITNILSMS